MEGGRVAWDLVSPHPALRRSPGMVEGRLPSVWASLPPVLLCNRRPWGAALAAVASPVSGGAGAGHGAGAFTRQLPSLLSAKPRASWLLGSVTRC